jgi:hypothetical protein
MEALLLWALSCTFEIQKKGKWAKCSKKSSNRFLIMGWIHDYELSSGITAAQNNKKVGAQNICMRALKSLYSPVKKNRPLQGHSRSIQNGWICRSTIQNQVRARSHKVSGL